ncbi:MAG TPA: GNAT family N-acetyltransferase [Pseudoxanthomonas sp.]
MPEPRPGPTPRAARMDDSAEVARLCTQLGYPATADEMAARMGVVISAGDRQVFVVEAGDRLLGWIAVELRTTLETGRKAEIIGLVVDAQVRRSGTGKVLVLAAENWVRQHGLDTMTVRSNTARLESHPFYEGIGFVRRKSQHVYFKALE